MQCTFCKTVKDESKPAVVENKITIFAFVYISCIIYVTVYNQLVY